MEMHQFLNEKIAAEAVTLGINWFEGFGHHPNWDGTIRAILGDHYYEECTQKVYKIEESQYVYENEPKINEEYMLLKITEENVALYHLLDNSFFKEQLFSFWSSLPSFYEKGMGYVALYDGHVVSICFSGFVSGNTHAVAIETLQSHQGKKLAQKLAHLFAQDCFKKGYAVYWDCMGENAPSIAIAKKLGFIEAFCYTVYEYKFS